MTVLSKETLALYGKLLPLILPWKDLEDDFEVLSLDKTANGWDRFLAAQGIGICQRKSLKAPFKAPSVVTCFDTPEVTSSFVLRDWAGEVLSCLKPGGILVVGGRPPGNAMIDARETFSIAKALAQELKEAGFERTCEIVPDPHPNDKSFASAICATSSQFVVVAQKQAKGKAFDVFTPTFLKGHATPQEFIERAEHAMHARIHSAETYLNDRISHLDTTLHERNAALEHAIETHIKRLEARLEEQTAQIAHLDLIIETLHAQLKRATRRRGLRKLAYEIKKALRPKPKPQFPPETGTPPNISEAPSEIANTDVKRNPALPPLQERRTGQTQIDPTPLSHYEAALRGRLFDIEAP